jgi:pimeloyl-ACP methyl ester carboxylesterase
MPRMSRTPRRMGARAALAVSAALGAACASGSGVTTERADADVPAVTDAPPPSSSDAPVDPSTDPSSPIDSAPPTTASPPNSDDPAPQGGGTIRWQPVQGQEQLEQGVLDVPIDYDDPSAGTYTMYLLRRLADDQENKIGSLLVNPGGPGFGEPLLERFDIVGWDPRGTGYTSPAIDCIEDYDQYYAGTDITPDDDAERQQILDNAEDLADQCATNNAEIVQHVGTNDSARDMDSIRRALGEETISYFGYSYGSELGAAWATLFPETVRAAVFDGAADPTADLTEDAVQQAAGFEGTLATYLASCSADTECTFHNGGDAEEAFDALMLSLDEQPIPSEPGRPDITRGVALQAVAQAMYDDGFWDQLSDALQDAQGGDGAGLLALWDSYFQRNPDGTWPNTIEAFQTIFCMDSEERPTVAESDATAAQVRAAAPRYKPDTTGDYFCTFFPPTEDPRVPITGAGAGPLVVVGTTGDPATPLASTRVMADTLEDGRLIVVTADKHTGYGVNECVDDAVHDYLVDLQPPETELQC